MNPSFNLIDEPWIPCLLDGGALKEFGLWETLDRAGEIQEIVADSPPVTVAIHRLLLALLHRCFGPENVAAWRTLWQSEAFDRSAVRAYLDRWHDRFDLFDLQRPFYQTPGAAPNELGSAAKLLLQADNNPTLFDHSVSASPPSLTPAQAARALLAIQAFDTGGMKTGRGPDKFAKAGPLIQAAVCLLRGRNLFQTLLLNLHQYRPEDREPFEFERALDAPAWEQERPVLPADRYPDGYLDLLTWQSRRVLLVPEESERGIVVRSAALMKGFQFPDGLDRHTRETMVAYRRATAKNAPDPWPALGFREERALWRDGPAFMQSIAETNQCPKTIHWLSQLTLDGVVARSANIRFDLLGLAADRAKLLFWRQERMDVPGPYLENSEEGRFLVGRLRRALDLADRASRLLQPRAIGVPTAAGVVWARSPLSILAEELVGASGPITDFINHLAAERGYWARLEEPFRTLLRALPDELTEDELGDPTVRGPALPAWHKAVESAVWQAFREATDGLESSAEGMRAVARAERELSRRLVELLRGEQEQTAGAAV